MDAQRRILVIANETCAGAAVCDEVRYRAGGAAEILVVAPALASSRVGHFLSSSVDDARAAAQERLDATIKALRVAGLDAHGELGDADPLQALDDAYRVFVPDEVVISTHPPARSNWLERRVVQKARDRYPVPVTHVVVDLVHEAALTHEDPRPGPRAPRRMVTLYCETNYDETLTARIHGFDNTIGGDRPGILFRDEPVESLTPDDPNVFIIDVPEDVVAPYEVTRDGTHRRFELPPDLVNRHQPRVLTSDWAE